MKPKETKITGYYYIDEPIEELLNLLPKEDRATYLNTFKNLYKAGVNEGIRIGKNINNGNRVNG